MNVEKLIVGFSAQLTDGIKSGINIKLNAVSYKNFDKILICGMGGSALPGDIFESWQNSLEKLNSEIIVHKNYGLPAKIRKSRRTLVICISYSGNTEETLSAYKQALIAKYPVIAITSGGKLEQIAKKNKKPFVLVPAEIPPRFALGYQLGALIGLFAKNSLISKKEQLLIIKAVQQIKYPAQKRLALSISKKLYGRIPVIYASEANRTLAYLLKINFNENAKIPAFINFFPELNHNEFNSFAVLSKKQKAFARSLGIFILKDTKDTKEILRRMRATEFFIKKSGARTLEIILDQPSVFKKTFDCLILSQWISVFLAQHYGVNPLPTELIERFKKELNK